MNRFFERSGAAHNVLRLAKYIDNKENLNGSNLTMYGIILELGGKQRSLKKQ